MAKKTPDEYKDFNASQYGLRQYWVLYWVQRVWDQEMSYIAKRVTQLFGVSLLVGTVLYLGGFDFTGTQDSSSVEVG